ncbi:hypothetical protein HMPREF1553_01345 [Porphyromonas gingivalis F0568]|nr:hypothetical protein HMPREF1553_01345 [Porphyromonas gingivalis F0568]
MIPSSKDQIKEKILTDHNLEGVCRARHSKQRSISFIVVE